MQLVTRATSIAAPASIILATPFLIMLMEIAVAVEVTGGGTPTLSAGSTVESPIHESPISEPSIADLPMSGTVQETSQPPSPNCFILGSRSFSIPFSVDAAGAQPVEVHLFVAGGPQDQWRLLDRKIPNVPKKQFQFEADRDGEFWFATRTVDSLGRLHPQGSIESQLKVYVDTTKPQVTFHADADADGRVQVSLAVRDVTNIKETVLRYVTDQVQQWVNVDLKSLSSDGRMQFQPDHDWTQLSIQLVASDTPGNQSIVNQLLKRPRLADSGDRRYAQVDRTPNSTSTPWRQPAAGDRDTAQSVPSNPVIKLDRVKTPAETRVATNDGAVSTKPSPRTVSYGTRGIARPPRPSSPTAAGAPLTPPSSLTPSPPFAAVPSAVPAPPPFAPPTPVVPNSAIPSPMIPASSPVGLPATPPTASIPTAGTIAPSETLAPRSLFGVLFGSGPPSPAGPPSSPGTGVVAPSNSAAAPAAMAPPNVRASQVQSRLAASVNTPLPPPATPEQISNGFRLDSPGQAQPEAIPLSAQAAPENVAVPEIVATPSPLAVGPLPETIPVPNNGQPDPQAAPRPQTPAEALRPIAEPSQVNAFPREEVPPPQGEPDPAYQSLRATPGPTQPLSPQDAVADMMQRAPVRYSDSQRFSLEYELEAVGAQGVDAVELYGSVDGGRTWDLWGQDPDRESPFDIEVKEAGLFAFRIVVVGRNGLASPRPIAGETPDLVVVVDTTGPVVRITGAQYGEGDRIGALVIQYECEDAHLRERPIALSFSDRLDGPWTTIAAGLKNDGEYVWTADPNLPRQFYLRIDAIDEAGNSRSYVLDQPIDAQGLAPRARIRGFQSLSGVETPSSGEGQTASGPQSRLK